MNLSNSRRTLRTRKDVSKQTHHQQARLAANLRLLLLGLARYLLKAGITPKLFGELAYGAFVEAAADISRCRNGRVNRSRIAVLTSLRRAEVKHFLSQSGVASAPWCTHQPRTHRVIAAWTADRRYLDSRGLPRRLPFRGGRASFASLVKEFAGDVPPRAVLEELRRLKVVREVHGYMDLIQAGRMSNRADPSVLELIDILLDGLEAANQLEPAGPSSRLYRAALSARDAIDLTLMRERVANGASAFLDGLERSLSTPSRSSMGSKKMKRGLTVTVLVRERSGLRRKRVQR